MTSSETGRDPVAFLGPRDDLRHRPAAGGRMRDSLFWEMVMPDEQLGLQVYLYLTDRGRTGYNVSVWGPDREPVALRLEGGTVPDGTDLDDFEFRGLHVEQPELHRTARVTYDSDEVRLRYDFTGSHEAFSYRANPDGIPEWFAQNRMEQSGRVSGFLELGPRGAASRRVEWKGRMGHRDHSWGPRDWGVPQHWKWFVAYTESGTSVNGWLWIARGEWGFAGYVARDGRTVAVQRIEQRATYDDDMTQRRLEATVIDVDGGRTEVVLDRYGLIKLPTNDRMATEIWESACHASIDGEPGGGTVGDPLVAAVPRLPGRASRFVSWDWSPADRAALGRFLGRHGLGAGPVTTSPIGDGHSNLTYLVSTGDRRVVVRRPPPPPVPAGAHDVLREAALLRGVADSDVDVPAVLATAEAGEVLGDVPLVVLSFVDGPVVTTTTPDALATPATRRAIGEALVDTLVALHAVDWRAAGLAGMGRPEGFNARHRRRLGRLVAGQDGEPPEDFAAVGAWLAAHVPPESGAAIVHNDFRLGNVIIGAGPPGRVAAVLDWELATLGDPLFDVGYFLACWPTPGAEHTPTQAMATAVLEPGWPGRDELADRYATLTGRDLTGLGWYTTLAHWKLAVLYEYSRRQGTDPYYEDPGLVRSFLEAAHRVAGL